MATHHQANQLITINYTMPNETAVSKQPIGDEFLGLSSTLLDPITGAYYDQVANQIYFFKGEPSLRLSSRLSSSPRPLVAAQSGSIYANTC